MNRLAVLSLAIFAAACTERASIRTEAEDGGTLVIATTADPGSLFPPLVLTVQGKQIVEQIYDYLADVGPAMNTLGDTGFRPELADGWRWSSDSLSIAFHINPHARWHDGQPVTARDVRFTLGLYLHPALGARMTEELANVDSVTAVDSLTAVFWFHRRSPTQFLDAAAQMLILPAHQLERIPIDSLRESAPAPVGSGRFRLRKWDRGASVEIVADSGNYRGRARLDRVIWSISPEFTTAVTKLFSGEADLFDALRPENLTELSRHGELRAIFLPGTDYAFLQFNLRDPARHARSHPLFGDRVIRRAVAMSIDRTALVRNVFDTLAEVALGPTTRAFPTTDSSIPQILFDSARAQVLLDSLGWTRRTSDGTRVRNGKDLAFTVIVPSSSLSRVRMAVLLQAQLRRVGIRVNIDQMDYSAFMSRLSAHSFDAALGAWHLGSSLDGTRQAWGTSGLGRNGVNYGSYSSATFDAQLDSALAAGDPSVAGARFTRAYQTINEDAAAVWLYEPKTAVGVHKRFRATEMRPNAWWTDLGSWSIPASERLPRDRIPLNR